MQHKEETQQRKRNYEKQCGAIYGSDENENLLKSVVFLNLREEIKLSAKHR